MSLKSYLSPQAYRSLQADRAKRLVTKVRYPDDRPIPDPIDWIENNFYLYDTAQLMSLYECQRQPLKLALSRDDNGHYRYNTIIWSWPKKSAKSSVIAAVADYIAEHKPNASVKLIANDLRQADSRVGYYLREAIIIGQRKGKRPNINITPSGYKVSYPNGAKVESVPIDPSGEAGGNDDMMVYSELWGWKSKAHQRMWAEMTISPNRFGDSQRWIDSYAGITGESPILEQLYETGVKQGRQLDPADMGGAEVYVNDAAKMLAVWVTKPMFPWQTAEYYAQEHGLLTDSEFDRIHGNKWANSQEVFIPTQWWEACQQPIPDLGRRGVVMGVDAASKDDCFAVVIVSKLSEDDVAVRYCKVWYPPKGGVIDFEEVEKEIERLYDVFSIFEVAYDPKDLPSTAQRLGKRVKWREFSQAGARLVADKRLYDMIRDRHVFHSGEPDLKQHIQNADRKPEEDKLRIVKRHTSDKIDAVIAMSMAVDRIMHLNL